MKEAPQFASELNNCAARSITAAASCGGCIEAVESRDAEWRALVEQARHQGELDGLRKAMNTINLRSKCDCQERIGEQIDALIDKAEGKP